MIKFVFNNKNSFDDMSCVVVGQVSYPVVAEQVETINVEGRSGSLTKKTGVYNDLTLSLKMRLVVIRDIQAQMSKINEWLTEFENNKLFFIGNESKCYKVKTVELKTFTPKNGVQVDFDVNFTLEPFIFLTDDHFIDLANNETILNVGFKECNPTIIFDVIGNDQTINITVNGVLFTVKEANENVVINSELLTCNHKNSGFFPTLRVGENTISYSDNVENFKILRNMVFRG